MKPLLSISYIKFILFIDFVVFFFETKSQYSFLFISYIKFLLFIVFVLSDKISIFIPLINGKIKDINIKDRTYYFYDDLVNMKDFDLSLLKLDEKSFKNIAIYCIGYIIKKR